MELTLLQIAEKILAANPKCSLSGSLALNLQGIKTRREPKDIDIFIPYDDYFNKVEGLVEINDFNNDDYREEDYDRTYFEYGENRIKIDLFRPTEDNPILELRGVMAIGEGITFIHIASIIIFYIL